MQYISDCLDCDHYLAAANEMQAFHDARDHSEETDHLVRHHGRYDSPINAGIYRDGDRLDLDDREKHDLIRRSGGR